MLHKTSQCYGGLTAAYDQSKASGLSVESGRDRESMHTEDHVCMRSLLPNQFAIGKGTHDGLDSQVLHLFGIFRSPNESGNCELVRIVAQNHQVKKRAGEISSATNNENVGLNGLINAPRMLKKSLVRTFTNYVSMIVRLFDNIRTILIIVPLGAARKRPETGGPLRHQDGKTSERTKSS